MFELQPQTLDTEVARRREVLRGTMRASRGDRACGAPGPRHRPHPPRRGDAGRDQGVTRRPRPGRQAPCGCAC